MSLEKLLKKPEFYENRRMRMSVFLFSGVDEFFSVSKFLCLFAINK